jgi:hypothetical protein
VSVKLLLDINLCSHYRHHHRCYLCSEYTEGKEGYIIVVNLFGTEQPVDLSAFATFERDEIRVATAAPNSTFKEG